jgi:hypothetical protein
MRRLIDPIAPTTTAGYRLRASERLVGFVRFVVANAGANEGVVELGSMMRSTSRRAPFTKPLAAQPHGVAKSSKK